MDEHVIVIMFNEDSHHMENIPKKLLIERLNEEYYGPNERLMFSTNEIALNTRVDLYEGSYFIVLPVDRLPADQSQRQGDRMDSGVKFFVRADHALFLRARHAIRSGTKLRTLLKGIVQNDIVITREEFFKWKEDVAWAKQEYIAELMQEIDMVEDLAEEITKHVVSGKIDER